MVVGERRFPAGHRPLQQLSYEASQRANQNWDFDPYEHIPLAITINRLQQAPVAVENVDGASVAAENHGD